MASFQALKQQRARRGAGAAGAGHAQVAPAPASAASSSASSSQTARPPHAEPLTDAAVQAASGSAAEARQESTAPSPAASPAGPPSYRLQPGSDLEVRRTEAAGRGIWWAPASAKSAIAGTTLLAITPHTVVLSSSHLDSHCSLCFRSAKEAAQVEPQTASGGAPARLQRCSGCRTLHYCSAACQRADWQLHRQECSAFIAYAASAAASTTGESQRRVASEPGTSVRALARLLWARQKNGASWLEPVKDMQSNRNKMSSQQLEPLGAIAARLAFFLGVTLRPDERPNEGDGGAAKARLKAFGLADSAQLLDFVCQYATNSFTAASSDLSPLGVAVAPQAALLNHSCVPNACVVFPFGPGGREHPNRRGQQDPLRVVAIREIKPGEEILTSYVDLSDCYAKRRQTLAERYLFACSCAICKHARRGAASQKKQKAGRSAWLDPREVQWCSQGCGGWAPYPPTGGEAVASSASAACVKCGALGAQPEVAAQARQSGESALERAERFLDASDPEAAWKVLRASIRPLSAEMPPSSYPLLALMRCAQTALIELAGASEPTAGMTASQMLDEATRLGLAICAGMQAAGGAVFCAAHPARAVALATLGKLLIADAQADGSQTHQSCLANPPQLPQAGMQRALAGRAMLLQAREELLGAFGRDTEGGAVGATVRDALQSLDAELSLLAAR